MSISSHYVDLIAEELGIGARQVHGTLDLLNDGGTIPFIARYRKEVTGSLDEVAIASIRSRYEKIQELEKRRESILQILKDDEQLTTELEKSIETAPTLTALEDIYLPYKKKRKTRASKARDLGLTDLAKAILTGQKNIKVESFIGPEGPATVEECYAGARDIIAEEISENQHTREKLRHLFKTQSILESKVHRKKEEEGAKYKDYFDWQEPANKAPSHRLLAMFRGEREKILKLNIAPPKESCIRLLKKLHLSPGPFQHELNLAIEDSYKRLLCPSMQNELSKDLKIKADEEAIQVFGENLRQLLLAPPLGSKRVLAIDPGYRTGCKVACLDEQGKLLETDTIFPTFGGAKIEEASQKIRNLVTKHRIEAIGVGDGTAGRETEEFIRSLALDKTIIVTLVNEDGASIYSASEIGREEFPDHDITVRGAVSIGRRLQDPLAELVKIDPKSIGVGQYQHDVNQTLLKDALQTVVESGVNNVGVELNSASSALLTYVSGLGKTLADNIISYRNENGPFTSRAELKKVQRLGPKAFEQCAGFLRISHGKNPLDASAVHPERYRLVQQMTRDLDATLEELLRSTSIRKKIDVRKYVSEEVGLPTLTDILEELEKPGRDPRDEFEQFRFDDTIHSIEDLRDGMVLPAIITNITRFGAFADIGVKQDGLIHISQLADRFVKDPGEVVKLGQHVEVRVLEVDIKRGRISLSMKQK